jgi:hypothetical protein
MVGDILKKICVYELYCVNLNHKALSSKELLKLKEADELIGTTWKAYNSDNMGDERY